jgi:hypothetical protein
VLREREARRRELRAVADKVAAMVRAEFSAGRVWVSDRSCAPGFTKTPIWIWRSRACRRNTGQTHGIEPSPRLVLPWTSSSWKRPRRRYWSESGPKESCWPSNDWLNAGEWRSQAVACRDRYGAHTSRSTRNRGGKRLTTTSSARSSRGARTHRRGFAFIRHQARGVAGARPDIVRGASATR